MSLTISRTSLKSIRAGSLQPASGNTFQGPHFPIMQRQQSLLCIEDWYGFGGAKNKLEAHEKEIQHLDAEYVTCLPSDIYIFSMVSWHASRNMNLREALTALSLKIQELELQGHALGYVGTCYNK